MTPSNSDLVNSSLPLKLPPIYETNTFYGRFRHFASVTDWRLCLASTRELNNVKEILHKHASGEKTVSPSEFKMASTLYQSAFHPDSGDLQNIIGRMSFQVPGGMLLTGAMMAFYKSTPAVVFWQWANQSFNALVNYTNRSASSDLSSNQLGVAYTSATTAALTTAIGLKHLLTGSVRFAVLQRFVPFMAVASANMVNIPLMRQSEIQGGVYLMDENGNSTVLSKVSATKGISQVVLSRIIMAAPGMLLIPLIIRRMEKMRWFRSAYNMPLQVLMCGVSLSLMVPLSCSIFDQKCSIQSSTLKSFEPEVYAELCKKYDGNPPAVLYFNKGL